MFNQLSVFERNTIVEIRARVLAGQPVSATEKQLVLTIIRNAGKAITTEVAKLAASKGFDITGIKTV